MRNKKNGGLLLAFPALTGFSVFYLIPFFITVWYSFSFGIGTREFVGLDNYRMIWKNDMFLLAVRNTLRFFVLSIPLILVVSFLLALLFQLNFKGRRFGQLSFFYPLMIPVASIVMVVRLLFSKQGMLNTIFLQGADTDWIHSEWAFWILIALFLWKNTGYHILIFFSGLQMIPKQYYEEARLDGAGAYRCFASITFPLMKPVIGLNFLLAMMNGFKCFREAFLIGGTHPHDSIYLLQHFMNNNFENLNYQRIAVVSVLLFLSVACVALLGAVLVSVERRREG